MGSKSVVPQYTGPFRCYKSSSDTVTVDSGIIQLGTTVDYAWPSGDTATSTQTGTKVRWVYFNLAVSTTTGAISSGAYDLKTTADQYRPAQSITAIAVPIAKVTWTSSVVTKIEQQHWGNILCYITYFKEPTSWGTDVLYYLSLQVGSSRGIPYSAARSIDEAGSATHRVYGEPSP